jgi:hypothetical protein
MKEHAVITGDIINFTQLDEHARQSLINEAKKLLKSWVKKPEDAEVFRGDSYQLIIDDVNDAINRSIQLICWFKKYKGYKNALPLSTRISIGIGKLAYTGKSVLDSDGEAFHQSGRNFDKMGVDELLTINTSNEAINKQIEIILVFINQIINQWNANQAEVIYLLKEDYTQQSMAQVLGIMQGAVNNRLKVAKWKEVDKGITYIVKLITQQ